MDRLNAEFAKSAGLTQPTPANRMGGDSRADRHEAAESVAAASEAAASGRAGNSSGMDSDKR